MQETNWNKMLKLFQDSETLIIETYIIFVLSQIVFF